MSFVLTEIAVQRLITYGINKLRKDEKAFRDIFAYMTCNPLMSQQYGIDFVDKMWMWFSNSKIPALSAWSLTPQIVPCYSVTLASDTEDESKAAINDFYGDGEDGEIHVSPNTTTVDIGCHASRNPEEVLWLYYILQYIILKNKNIAEYLGLQLQTQSASDWARENKTPENIYTRWVRFRVTIYNTWLGDGNMCVEDLDIGINFEGVNRE
jgi:hypothetical protein